jgi:hypothetical protein
VEPGREKFPLKVRARGPSACRGPDCRDKLLPASSPARLNKYCSKACRKAAKKLQDKQAKARYLQTEKGKRAKKRENARYRKGIEWNDYMRAYRLRNSTPA